MKVAILLYADAVEQGAPFDVEGSDEDSCLRLFAGKGQDAVVVNLGPPEAVATKLAVSLAEIDFEVMSEVRRK